MRNQVRSSGIRNRYVHMRGPETLETVAPGMAPDVHSSNATRWRDIRATGMHAPAPQRYYISIVSNHKAHFTREQCLRIKV